MWLACLREVELDPFKQEVEDVLGISWKVEVILSCLHYSFGKRTNRSKAKTAIPPVLIEQSQGLHLRRKQVSLPSTYLSQTCNPHSPTSCLIAKTGRARISSRSNALSLTPSSMHSSRKPVRE